MMSVCGINCSECPCLKGTTNLDTAALEATAKEWSGKDSQFSAADMICLGCTPSNKDVIFTGAKSCGVRLCAIAKKVELCALCKEFATCEKIQKMLAGREEKTRNAFVMISKKAAAARA